MNAIAVQTHEDGVLVVDSRLIADQLGIEHESLIKNISTHQTQIEQAFGILRFEVGKPQSSKGGRPERFVFLTEAQSTFVMTLSRNTEQVVKCKLGLVQAFEKAKAALKSGDYGDQFHFDRQIRLKELDVKLAELDLEKLKLTLPQTRQAETQVYQDTETPRATRQVVRKTKTKLSHIGEGAKQKILAAFEPGQRYTAQQIAALANVSYGYVRRALVTLWREKRLKREFTSVAKPCFYWKPEQL